MASIKYVRIKTELKTRNQGTRSIKELRERRVPVAEELTADRTAILLVSLTFSGPRIYYL